MRLLVLGALAAVLATPAAARPPSISVTDATPFTVHGTGFAAHEHVRVVVTARSTATRWTTASATGAFTLQFRTVTLGACGAYAIRAYGSDGSQAVVRVRPACVPGPVDQ